MTFLFETEKSQYNGCPTVSSPPPEALVRSIVNSVTDHEEVVTESLDPPLYDLLDTEALIGLVASADPGTVHIEFRHRGHVVVIDGADEVSVRTDSDANGEWSIPVTE